MVDEKPWKTTIKEGVITDYNIKKERYWIDHLGNLVRTDITHPGYKKHLKERKVNREKRLREKQKSRLDRLAKAQAKVEAKRQEQLLKLKEKAKKLGVTINL